MVKEDFSDKIFLITIDKPQYIMEIGESLYGEKRSTYPKLMGEKGAIKRCETKGLIQKATIPPPDDKPSGFDKRVYYSANMEIIYNNILDRIELFDQEKTRVHELITHPKFKSCINDLSVFIDYPNQHIDAFEFITEFIGYFSANIYMIKNYGNYYQDKITSSFNVKKHLKNWFEYDMNDIKKTQKKAEKKGFNKHTFLEENKELYSRIFPESKSITKEIKGELVNHFYELLKEYWVLPEPLLKKLTGVIPVHKYIFLNFMTTGFVTADISNQLVIDKLLKIVKPKIRLK